MLAFVIVVPATLIRPPTPATPAWLGYCKIILDKIPSACELAGKAAICACSVALTDVCGAPATKAATAVL
jgi:hypothetical protein